LPAAAQRGILLARFQVRGILNADARCEKSGHGLKGHFLGITKMIDPGSGAKRKRENVFFKQVLYEIKVN